MSGLKTPRRPICENSRSSDPVFWDASLGRNGAPPLNKISKAQQPNQLRILFDDFVLERFPLSLSRQGERVSLTPQAARLLDLLVCHSGEIVTADQIRHALWAEDVHVDFVQGIHFNIRQLRVALGDDPKAPQFIETVPRSGYRFVSPVRIENAKLGTVLRRRRKPLLMVSLLLVALLASFTRMLNDQEKEVAQDDARHVPTLEPQVRRLLDRGEVLQTRDAFSRQKAVSVFEEAIELAPDAPHGHEGLVRTLLSLERIEAAEHAAKTLIEIHPPSVTGLCALAHAAFFLSLDASAAIRHIDAALLLAPDDLRCRTLRIGVLMSLSRVSEALEEARAVARDNPLSFVSQYNLAWAHFHARQFEHAVEQAHRALELAPRHTFANELLVEGLLRLGRPAEALSAANRYLEDWDWGPAGAGGGEPT